MAKTRAAFVGLEDTKDGLDLPSDGLIALQDKVVGINRNTIIDRFQVGSTPAR